MTATVFAREMRISYPTVIRWLDRKLVPGAELKESPERGKWWEIPETALEMERPTPGPKKGSKRGNGQITASPATKEKAARPAKKARKAGSKKKFRASQ